MSTAKSERKEISTNEQEGANKKQKTTLNDDISFLKKVSSDPDRAFKILCDFRSSLVDADPAAAKQAMDQARDGKCTIAECNNILDGSWNLVANSYGGAGDPTKREVVGNVSFSANNGRISLDSLWMDGGFEADDTDCGGGCSAYAKALSFEIEYNIMGETESGTFRVNVFDGKGKRNSPYQFPKASLSTSVDAEELDLPKCYGSLVLVKDEEE
mmetsp:Transcript_30431/g.50217  ORF Transcript_30431/g.50217 Transcript_30431/m.50217 type:complete len:214 (-) Transcript_30431:159-800(-)|eukprot:CAMPEP_0119016166 /NCGR_PEP_ID=MMETSP1176-20130426/11850_1 /TAXON_ID=265551 /ORGANISM="Synedropsis recta cf, Strain CCMP1620" /LENGTH=213 /DNA_ID=CAMNT_0006969499 /DNA_START=97 /DNA_END=738 /DNA_ORIENTATION=-